MISDKVELVTTFLIDVINKGFFHLLSANIIVKIIGFGSQIFLISLLSPVELGQIKTLQTFSNIAIVFAAFGFNTAILTLCSESRPHEERVFILKRNMLYSGVSTIAVLVVLYLLAKFQLVSPDKKINEYLPYFMFSIPSAIVLGNLICYLQAIKEVKKIATSQIVFRLFSILIIITSTWYYGLRGFIFSTVFAGYFFLPVLYFYIRKIVSNNGSAGGDVPLSKNLYYAKWSFLALVVHTFSQHMDIILLNYLITDREGFGYYSIATVFLIPFRQVISTIRSISVPYLSEKKNNKEEFMRVINKYRKIMLFQAAGLILVSIVVVPFLVKYFYGDNYADVSTYFCIIILGYIFQSYMALLPTSLISLGMMKYNFFSSIVYLPFSFVLNYIFITNYGLIGAAVAQVLTSIVIMCTIIHFSHQAIDKHFMSV